MKPNFLNLFMKKLTRDRVVSTMSAKVSWLILGTTDCAYQTWPKTTTPVEPGHQVHEMPVYLAPQLTANKTQVVTLALATLLHYGTRSLSRNTEVGCEIQAACSVGRTSDHEWERR